MVVRGKEGGDARHQVVLAVGIRADDHVAIVVAVQIGDLAQQGDGVVARGEAFGLPCSGDCILFDLMALGGITEFGAGRFVSDTTVVDVRVADLPAPRPGDLIVIVADSFTIQGEPVRDRERLIWTLDLRPS